MSALIELSDCRLRSDDHQWVIEKKYIKAKDQSIYYIPETYHPNLKWAAVKLQERTLRTSEAESLEEIITILKRLEVSGVKIEMKETPQ